MNVHCEEAVRKEIRIVDGHNGASYFWIMPVRVVDSSDTNDPDNADQMRSAEISIEEDDIARYLFPFLKAYFDDSLEANQRRVDYCRTDADGHQRTEYVCGFEWNLTHNYYTLPTVEGMLKDIQSTVEALSSGKENEYTAQVALSGTPVECILDFYRRFICRMEKMLAAGKENGYDLISFMGP